VERGKLEAERTRKMLPIVVFELSINDLLQTLRTHTVCRCIQWHNHRKIGTPAILRVTGKRHPTFGAVLWSFDALVLHEVKVGRKVENAHPEFRSDFAILQPAKNLVSH